MRYSAAHENAERKKDEQTRDDIGVHTIIRMYICMTDFIACYDGERTDNSTCEI